MIKVKKTKSMGRGVFATKPIKRGSVIATNHMITYPTRERNECKKRISLFNYDFDVSKTKCGIALGVISLLNHNDDPNVDYTIDVKNEIIKIKAIKSIKRGEQLFIDYGYDPLVWK